MPGSTFLELVFSFTGSVVSATGSTIGSAAGASLVSTFFLTSTGRQIYGVLSSTLLFIPITLS